MAEIEIDDESPTTALVRPLIAQLAPPARRPTPIPPPLPVALRRRVSFGPHELVHLGTDDQAWLATLPDEQRAVLEAAAQPSVPWPHAERISGAVCTPIE
jgi:hypothetical protein